MNDKKRIVGVVLAAGKGTRMYPFSYTIPKVMIPFWGKPLLAYHIDEFIQSNVTDIVIICSNDNIQMIKEYFTDNYQDIKIDYAIQEQPLGTANAIESASEFIKNSMALIKFGDNISKASLTSTLINNYNGYSNGIMTLKKVDNPSDYGIAILEDDSIIEIIEKPEKPSSNLASMGGFLLDADILLKAIKEHGYYSIRNNAQIEMPLPQYFLMQKLKLGYAILNEPVLDVGRPFDIISANRLFAEVNNKALSSSYMGSNAKIGKNCIIKGACSIEGILEDNVIIEDSYIMKGTIIGKDSKIQKSVIGENVIIGNNVSILSEHATIIIKGKKMSPKEPIGSFIGSNSTIADNSIIHAGIIISPNSKV